ncbi:transcriptional regulator, TetR family [Streptococcus sp. oral taxon 056 str. F0418]|uniref:TetR/AcrR family transcriptional regulator n=1 Tax=Streptococcus sp. oral taxon 056 TaxID=712620 RepID=UPI0002181150|nr:TetR/AcrR family transcriptional regulator [Streptococcus sp. oral taxon 056]EGP66981.1 transcriptional regulator, TetR family [Streptococcus sp. oral taxon 056 str. F0418]
MSERKMSSRSLENLIISNQESNRLTKEALEISLMQLLEKKELAKITISELVHRAGVSRAAFYRNYSSKEQMLEEIFGKTVQKIMDKLGQFNLRTELYQVWIILFKEAKKKARLISLAVDYNLEKHLTQAVFNFLEKRQQSKREASSYIHSFWSSALVSVLSKWIKDGMQVPAEKIASLGLPLMIQGKSKEKRK